MTPGRSSSPLAVALVLLVAAGCGGEETPVTSPQGSPPETAAGSPTATADGAASGGETGSGGVTSGEATLESSEGTETLGLNEQGYLFADGGFAGSWSNLGGGDFLTITSGEGTGTFPTSPMTTVSARLSLGAVGDTVRIRSTDGGCTVTVTRADESGVEGSFECPDDGVSGRFSAG